VFRDDLLAGKRILITGGGTGLGKSMGRRFLELGASLSICGRRAEVLEEAAAQLGADFPGRVHWQACDIRDASQVADLVEACWQRWGGLDVLVNNAAGNFAAKSETLSHRAFDAVVNIVLHGTAYVTLEVGKRWVAEQTPGTVLSIVTSYAWTGSAYVLPSAAAKAGVLAMTRSLAVEWGPHGIRLNAIAPGPFPTEGAWSRLIPNEKIDRLWHDKIPLKRYGDHRELADLASYLVADGSGYVTGEVVTIDGGEWLGGAGQFNLLSELTDAEWAEWRAKTKG
jgi:NAD(P)-dependent dehydrogenase (short-subunit alcohol dehydrogenase family)